MVKNQKLKLESRRLYLAATALARDYQYIYVVYRNETIESTSPVNFKITSPQKEEKTKLQHNIKDTIRKPVNKTFGDNISTVPGSIDIPSTICTSMQQLM